MTMSVGWSAMEFKSIRNWLQLSFASKMGWSILDCWRGRKSMDMRSWSKCHYLLFSLHTRPSRRRSWGRCLVISFTRREWLGRTEFWSLSCSTCYQQTENASGQKWQDNFPNKSTSYHSGPTINSTCSLTVAFWRQQRKNVLISSANGSCSKRCRGTMRS